MTGSNGRPPDVGVPSDNTTLVGVMQDLRKEGYEHDLVAAPEGELTCSNCGHTSPADAVDIGAMRRLEGASDPADEMIVVAGTCPSCDACGLAILGYGPEATPIDDAVVRLLDLPGPSD